MIQASIPASVPLKDFDYNAEVELINPVADTVANATFRGADVDWYIKADDLILKGKTATPSTHNQKSTSTKDKLKKEGSEFDQVTLLSFFNLSSLDCLVYGLFSLSLFM